MIAKGSRSGSPHAASPARREFVLAAVNYLLGTPTAPVDASSRRASSSRGGSSRRDLERRSAHDVGIRMVAELVKRSHAAPLFHFPDRTCLMAAVAAEGFRRLVRDLDQALSRKGSGSDGVKHLTIRYAQWAGESPALFEAMYDPSLASGVEQLMLSTSPDETLEQFRVKYSDELPAARRRLSAFQELLEAKAAALAVFVRAVQIGMQDGSLRNDLAEQPIAHAVTSLADGLAWQRVTEAQGDWQLLDRHAAKSIGLLLEGIAA